jgi:hypothetical protein
VSDEMRPDQEAEAAADKSERILEDTYLSGAVGMGASGPRLSASALHGAKDDGADFVHEDSSWRSHAVEEGDEEPTPAASGTWGRLRRWLHGR